MNSMTSLDSIEATSLSFSSMLSQLIYDFKDGGASLGLISLHPDQLPEEDKLKFEKIGVSIPSMK